MRKVDLRCVEAIPQSDTVEDWRREERIRLFPSRLVVNREKFEPERLAHFVVGEPRLVGGRKERQSGRRE
jgi:hypothetical protein